MSILPTKINGKISVQNVDLEFQQLPRVVLDFYLDAKTYPSDEPPAFVVVGFWQDNAYSITCRLNERFVPGCLVLYDWYALVKDELFTNANGELDKIFFPNGSNFILSKQRLELLQDELR